MLCAVPSAHQLVRLQVTPHVEAHRDKIIQIVSQHPLPQPPSFDPAESSEVRHNPSRVPQTYRQACMQLTLSGCVWWSGGAEGEGAVGAALPRAQPPALPHPATDIRRRIGIPNVRTPRSLNRSCCAGRADGGLAWAAAGRGSTSSRWKCLTTGRACASPAAIHPCLKVTHASPSTQRLLVVTSAD